MKICLFLLVKIQQGVIDIDEDGFHKSSGWQWKAPVGAGACGLLADVYKRQQLQLIERALERRIKGELEKLLENDREKYEALWQEMCIRDRSQSTPAPPSRRISLLPFGSRSPGTP